MMMMPDRSLTNAVWKYNREVALTDTVLLRVTQKFMNQTDSQQKFSYIRTLSRISFNLPQVTSFVLVFAEVATQHPVAEQREEEILRPFRNILKLTVLFLLLSLLSPSLLPLQVTSAPSVHLS